jgi:hypothetical protein
VSEPSVDDADAGKAWDQLLDVLGGLPSRMNDLGFPSDGAAADEALRHLARQLGFALRDQLEHSDISAPTLHRYELPWSQWGAPNPDNVYLRCAIDPTATYELRGDATDVHEALFSLLEGDMHLGENDVHDEVALSDLQTESDGSVTIRIGPTPGDGNHLTSQQGTRLLLIRQYLWDWEREPVAPFTIRVVEPGTGVRDDLATELRKATTWVEQSIVHWSEYAAASRDLMEHNTVTSPNTPPGGAPSIAYGGACWDLGEGEVLLLEHDRPDAHYWNWSVHHLHRFDSGPWHRRPMSCNGSQAHIDADGRVRLVVSSVDPGAPNWLDTQGEALGLIVYRYVGARTRPQPVARVTPRAELRELLPPDHPVIDPEQRREQLARRSLAAQRRWS